MYWTFEDRTNGITVSCNDLKFLMREIRESHELKVPKEAEERLIVTGRVDMDVEDEDGEIVSIIIEERHLPIFSHFYYLKTRGNEPTEPF